MLLGFFFVLFFPLLYSEVCSNVGNFTAHHSYHSLMVSWIDVQLTNTWKFLQCFSVISLFLVFLCLSRAHTRGRTAGLSPNRSYTTAINTSGLL